MRKIPDIRRPQNYGNVSENVTSAFISLNLSMYPLATGIRLRAPLVYESFKGSEPIWIVILSFWDHNVQVYLRHRKHYR